MNREERDQLIALAWDGEPAREAGPRRALTVQQIVDVAVDLADQSGLAAASMPKLAKALGVGTMSLYRYVPSKSVLTMLMVDSTAYPLPVDRPRDGCEWEDAIRFYASNELGRYQRHPWVLDVEVTGFPQTPGLLAWIDYGLGALASAGFDESAKLGSLLLIDGHVAAVARFYRTGHVADDASAGTSEPPLDRLDSAHYTELAQVIRAGGLDKDDFADYGYHYGLERIIAGIKQAQE